MTWKSNGMCCMLLNLASLSLSLFPGSILVSVNPYRLFDMYGLDAVSRYEGAVMGQLPPHLFAVGAQAYQRMLAKNGENQVSSEGLIIYNICMRCHLIILTRIYE